MDIGVFFQGLDDVIASRDKEETRRYLDQNLSRAEAEDDRHAEVAILNEMVGFFRNISDYAKSLEAADRAMAAVQALGRQDTVAYGTTLLNCATAHRASGDSVKALELFILALGIFGKHLPADDYRLAGLFNNLGSIYEESGRYDEALDVLQRAAAILEKHEGAESDAATVQSNLALVYLSLDREAEAMAALAQAQSLFGRSDTAGRGGRGLPPQYAAAIAGVGAAHYRAGRHTEAVTAYESALAHLKACCGENRDYAVTCHNYAAALAATGQSEKAAELSAKADAILERLGVK